MADRDRFGVKIEAVDSLKIQCGRRKCEHPRAAASIDQVVRFKRVGVCFTVVE